jgi:hypothetical protein
MQTADHLFGGNCCPAVPEACFVISHFPDNYSLCIRFHGTYWRSSRTVEPFTHCTYRDTVVSVAGIATQRGEGRACRAGGGLAGRGALSL